MKSNMQEVHEAEKETKAKCPWCGSTRFVRKRTDVVEFYQDGIVFVRTEVFDHRADEHRLLCAGCDRDLTDIELR